MKVFVTGATGFVGSAVVDDLIRRGHSVLGLVRSEASATALMKAGATPLRGDLTDLKVIQSGVSQSDGVIHLGFNHDFSKFKENCENDRRTLLAMGETLKGTMKPLVVTSGIGVLPGPLVTEELRMSASSKHPRALTEITTEELREKGINVSVVRLPPTTHGTGDHGFVPMLIDIARKSGISAYIGEGKNTWPAVHRQDAALVFTLALEKAEPGAIYHPVAESGIEFKKIADVIAKRLGIPAKSLSQEEAARHFAWFAGFAAFDLNGASQKTREALDWNPTHPNLIEDLDRPEYFVTSK